MKKYTYPHGATLLFGDKETVTEEVMVRGHKTTARVKIDKPAILVVPTAQGTYYFESGPDDTFTEIEDVDKVAALITAIDAADAVERAPKF